MRFSDDQKHIGLSRRWISCFVHRTLFVALLGPAALSVLWLLVGLLEPTFLPNHLMLAYGLIVASSLAFGAVFWGDSPAALRGRLMELFR